MTFATPGPTVPRMSDPLTRRRVAIMLAALFALAWLVVRLFGEPTGPFSPAELRHVSGVPYAPPQIERRITPPARDTAEFQQQVDRLESLLRGETAQPTPTATR